MDVGASLWNFDGAAAPFVDPRSIAGLHTWYDSSDVASITKDGSNNVSSWANKGGALGTYPLTATTTARPTYVADDGDGKPCLSFTAANYIRNINSNSMNEDTGFIVVSIGGVDADAGGVFGHGTNLVNTTSSQLNWSIAGSTDGAAALRMGPPLIRQQYIVLSCRRGAAYNMYYGGSGNTGIIEVCENGATVKKTTHTSGSVGGGIYISNAGVATVMKVREMCWFNRCLSDAEKLQMENYLNNKWNVYNNFAGRRDYHSGLQRWFTKYGTTAPSRTVPLFGDAGQSNLGGRGLVADLTSPLTLTIPNAFIWNAGTSTFDALLAGSTNQSNNSTQHGIEIAFMYDYTADFGEARFVKTYVDGTDIPTYWLPSNANGTNLTRNHIDRVWAAQYSAGYNEGVHLPYVSTKYYQGEADTGNVAWWTNYQANEALVVNAIREKTLGGSTSKWISLLVNSAAYGAEYQAVNAAKTANSLVLPNYFTVPKSTSLLDSVHADSAALNIQGNACALLMGCTTQVGGGSMI